MSEKAKEIFENIKEKKIKPASKWKFILRDYFLWSFFGVATLVGAVAMSVIIFIIKDNDWDIYEYLDKSFLSYILILMPYFWIIILFVLAYLAYFNYKQTRKGYKINPYWVILGSILVSVVLGILLFNLKIGSQIDKNLSGKIPFYRSNEIYKENFWSNPERGLLSGEIVDIKEDDHFAIRDLNYQDWEVTGKDILWKDRVNKVSGERVKIIGAYLGENKFEAKEVRPWSCHCQKCAGGGEGEGEGKHQCLSGNNSPKEASCSK